MADRICRGVPKLGIPQHTAGVSEFGRDAGAPDGLNATCRKHREEARLLRERGTPAAKPTAAVADTKDAPRGARKVDPAYFWEKPEDRAASDLWIELARAGKKKHMLIVGPSGCGKTEGIRLAADRVGLPFYKIDCPAMTTDERWLGHKEVDRDGTKYMLSDHLRWLEGHEVPPGIVLYDEINRLHASRMNILLPLLDGFRAVHVPELHRTVNLHPDTLIAATANFGAGFAGTWAMDVALKDRFGLVIERDFPPADEEVKIIVQRTGADRDKAKVLVDIAAQVRVKAREGTVGMPLSTRDLIDAGDLVGAGMGVFEAAEYSFVKKYSDEGGSGSERGTIRTIVSGKVGTTK